jgi:DNA-directed RNA polymerase specialized sigma24 family protein
LPAFNRLIQAHQTRLYSIAYRTLGSQPLAETATQAAIENAYRQGAGRDPARAEAALLRSLVATLRRASLVSRIPADGPLGNLPFDLRLPLVLIDVAGLNYEQAADALHTTLVELIQQLARGRRSLLQHRASGLQSPTSSR